MLTQLAAQQEWRLMTCRFGDEEDKATGVQADGPGPILSTALAVACYWLCTCAYAAFLFVPVYDDKVDDFEVKVSLQTLTIS